MKWSRQQAIVATAHRIRERLTTIRHHVGRARHVARREPLIPPHEIEVRLDAIDDQVTAVLADTEVLGSRGQVD